MLKIFNALLIAAANTGGGLPAGYTQVDYVKNISATSESSCIPTGIYTDIDDFEFEMKVEATTGDWYMFCAKKSSSSFVGIRGTNSYTTLRGDAPGGYISWNGGRATGVTLVIKFSYKNGNAYLEAENLTTGTKTSDTTTYTYAEKNAEIKMFMQVLANNKVYYAKIKRAGVLVADYVPAVDSNNIAGFYDMVSKSFKTGLNTSIYSGPTE